MVRHVRDGKDEVDDKGPLLNEDKEFSLAGRNDEWVVTLWYLKNLGFQFKCYAKYPADQKETVISFLASSGLREESPDETDPNRVWFLSYQKFLLARLLITTPTISITRELRRWSMRLRESKQLLNPLVAEWNAPNLGHHGPDTGT